MGISPTTITGWLRRVGRRLRNNEAGDDPSDLDADSSASTDDLSGEVQDRLLGVAPTAQQTAYSSAAMAGLPILPLFNPLNPNAWFQGVINALATGMTSVLGTLFVGMVKSFLIISPVYHQGGANATFMQNLHYDLFLFPTVIVLGAIAGLFSEGPESSYMRQAFRLGKALFALALIRPFIHVAIVLTNDVTKLVMPQTYAISLAGPVFHNALNDIFGSAIAGVLVYLAAGAVSVIAIAIVVMILFLRIFMIHLVYTSFPILLLMWYTDWGPLKYTNDVAMFLFKITAYLLLVGPLIALALQAGCTMSAPGVCVAHGSGAHGAQALTAGINPAQNQLSLWKRFLGWLSGLGLAGFIGIQALSMGGSSAGHLMGLGGLSAMRGGGGGGSGAGTGGGGGGGSGGGGPTPAGGGAGGQHTLRGFGGGAGNGPSAYGQSGSPKPEFHPRQAASSAKANLKQRASSARNTAKGHAQRAHRGVKSRKDWMQQASWKEGAQAGAQLAGGGVAIGAREAKAGMSHVKNNLNEPIAKWPGHAYNRMKNGDWNPPADDLGAGTAGEQGADGELLALPEGQQPLPAGETASPSSVSSTAQARYEYFQEKDQQKVEFLRPDTSNTEDRVTPPQPSASNEQVQRSVHDFVERNRNNGS